MTLHTYPPPSFSATNECNTSHYLSYCTSFSVRETRQFNCEDPLALFFLLCRLKRGRRVIVSCAKRWLKLAREPHPYCVKTTHQSHQRVARSTGHMRDAYHPMMSGFLFANIGCRRVCASIASNVSFATLPKPKTLLSVREHATGRGSAIVCIMRAALVHCGDGSFVSLAYRTCNQVSRA